MTALTAADLDRLYPAPKPRTLAKTLDHIEAFDKPPRAVLIVDVAESFLHCAKALMRSKLWSQAALVGRSALPTLGEMIRDQTRLDTGNETPEQMVARYRGEL